MLLRNCVAPRRAEWLQHQPRLSKLASLDPVGLHACPTARLAGLWISPLERKAKPRSIAFKRVIVYDDTYIRPLLSGLGDLGCQSAPKRDPESASNRDPHRRLRSGRPRSPWRGPARVAQCPHKRRSGARGEALWTPGGDPRAPSGPVFEAPALVAGFEDVAVMGQPVEQRRGHLGVGEDARPFGKGEIG